VLYIHLKSLCMSDENGNVYRLHAYPQNAPTIILQRKYVNCTSRNSFFIVCHRVVPAYAWIVWFYSCIKRIGYNTYNVTIMQTRSQRVNWEFDSFICSLVCETIPYIIVTISLYSLCDTVIINLCLLLPISSCRNLLIIFFSLSSYTV